MCAVSLLTGRKERLMKKKIAALAVVMMMMATFSIPSLAIQNGQQDVVKNENCLEIFCDLFESIEQKIRKILGFDEDESEETDSGDCSGCAFEVESADTKVWLAYIGS